MKTESNEKPAVAPSELNDVLGANTKMSVADITTELGHPHVVDTVTTKGIVVIH